MSDRARLRKMVLSAVWTACFCPIGIFAYNCAYKSVDGKEAHEGGAETPLFETVLHNVEEYRGEKVHWAGRIMEVVERTPAGEFVLQHVPLDMLDVERPAQFSKGRFIARGPERATPGMDKVTVDTYVEIEGIVQGSEVRPLVKEPTVHPVIGLTGMKVLEVDAVAEEYPDSE